MRLANRGGRAAIITDARLAVDVETASEGAFGSDPQGLFADWTAFREWTAAAELPRGERFALEELGPPVPRPAQVFAIGINYAEHAAEAGYPPESLPVTFTKFPTSLTGPNVTVELPVGSVDWEVELVVTIASRAERVPVVSGWKHIAGLMVGQDLSERESQLAGAKPQFSLGKSFPGFGPTGPWLVTPDEFEDPDDLAISCSLSGQLMQNSRTSMMIYTVPELVARLSAVCTLLPGDIIFTGTPSGVGNAMTPPRFISPADTLHSEIEGIGALDTSFR